MTAEPRSVAASFWLKYSGIVWLAVLFAILIMRVFLPGSYRRALDFAFDALWVALFATVAALVGWGIVRNVKTIRPSGYLAAVIAFGLAFISIWNFAALYTAANLTPVTVFGWDFSARPIFYCLPVLILLLLSVAATKLRGNRPL